MKTFYKSLCLGLFLIAGGCSDNVDCVKINEKEIIGMLSTQKPIKDTLIVTFSNNPHNFSANNYVSLSFNNKKGILQNFANYIVVDRPGINEGSLVNIKLNRYVKENDSSFCFTSYENKETVSWQSKFKYLYVSFSPTNDNTDEIQFYLSDAPAHN
jgi:hypothetical protein